MTTSPRVLITGGGSGLGAELARSVSDQGGRAVALDLVAKEDLSSLAGVRFVACDVTDPAAVSSAVAQAAEWLEGIDSVLLAAGSLGMVAPLVDLRPEEWRRVLSVNLDGAFYSLQSAVPHMRDGGSIVAICSVAGLTTFGTPGAAAYMVAKAGLATLVRVAALECAHRRIRVNAIAPGAVTGTRFVEHAAGVRGVDELPYVRFADIPLGGTTTPEDVLSSVRFLFSDAASRITGSVIVLDGGQGLLGSARLKAV